MICGTRDRCQRAGKKEKKSNMSGKEKQNKKILLPSMSSPYTTTMQQRCNNDATTIQQRSNNDPTTYLTGRVWTQQVGNQQLMPPSFDDDGLVGRRGR
jgi:hypothetical protein